MVSRLPARIGGEPIRDNVSNGTEIAGREADHWEDVVLDQTDAKPADVTFATGFTSPQVGYSSFVLRIQGVPGERLFLPMVDGFGFVPMHPESTVIDGKRVVSYACWDGPPPAECESYFYAFDDVAISLAGPHELVREALRQLP